jgi:tricorn protease
LVGGGSVSVPGWAFVNLAGQWDIERVGVAPDIEVDTLPGSGVDPQLERAIAEAAARLPARPPAAPTPPPFPLRP